ncbi:MAG TPA: radical SAM protein [Thermoanaerobaculaceae bacterium]|nr:radical SAM protein [Thermoanaerobaculaceae bacterium]HRS17025.1 radical SAM protein [Thermoanaerobaculaceae bacterium]
MRHRHVYLVPSRRLGRSLGVDLVPHKCCSFDCIYCQLGPTTELTTTRRDGTGVQTLVAEVEAAIAHGPRPDFVTLSGSGEPTLYEPIGELIEALGKVFRPIAVLTNGSLLTDASVRDALSGADLVLPSLDAADDATFTYVNRPHPDLTFAGLINGMVTFRQQFKGEIWLEIMMLGGVTATGDQASKLAQIATRIRPDRIQLNTVVRPPAVAYALPAPRNELESLCQCFHPRAEVIAEPLVSNTSSHTAVSESEVLEIVRRRPCTVGDLAMALGAPSPAVTKTLQSLLASRTVCVRICGRRVFFAIDEGVNP